MFLGFAWPSADDRKNMFDISSLNLAGSNGKVSLSLQQGFTADGAKANRDLAREHEAYEVLDTGGDIKTKETRRIGRPPARAALVGPKTDHANGNVEHIKADPLD